MIIACPACATRYVVPDSAIGVDGRTVRCAKCKHSWFQDGPDLAAPAPTAPRPVPERAPANPAPRPAPAQASAPGPTRAARAPAAPPQQPVTQPSPSPAPAAPKVSFDDGFAPRLVRDEGQEPDPAPVPATDDFAEAEPPFREREAFAAPAPADGYDDDVSPFDHAPPFRRRRNWARIGTIAAGAFAVLALGTVALVSYAGVPDWLPIARPLFAAGDPDLKLDFPVSEQERRTLPNGTEFFGAKIRVTNTARESRPLPDILIVLRDQRERQVYSWVVNPPQARLAPGETVTINEAVTDVPRSAVFADIGWAPR